MTITLSFLRRFRGGEEYGFTQNPGEKTCDLNVKSRKGDLLMLDYMMHGASGRIYSGSAYRCQRCGHGPVSTSDGFIMSHCMNCGNWQGYQEPVDFGIGRLKDKILAHFKSLKSRLLASISKIQVRPVIAGSRGET